MKTKTVTVLANQKVLLVSRNAEKNLRTMAKVIAPAMYLGGFSQNLFWFHHNFCLRNDTELSNDSNYR